MKSGTRIWIVDGHNVIFAIPRLERLQVTGRGEEARKDLVTTLRRFAEPRRQKVLVVFDGDDLSREPGVVRESLLEVTYTRRSAGGADGRIIREARSLLEQGRHVTVVTNDIHTLARELPHGVEHVLVRPFWQKYLVPGRTDKTVEGDFSDLESEMLATVSEPEAPIDVPAPHDAPRSAGKTLPASAPGVETSGTETPREQILRKKARGRARQERRLKRRLKPGRE